MAQRRSKRFKLSQLIPVAVDIGTQRILGVAVDISATGILVRCDDALPMGAIVRLAVGRGTESVRTMAVARRLIQGVGVGFEFRNISMTNRAFLNRLLLRLSRESITGIHV